MAVCVLREHCRSTHSAASDDPTGGSCAVARNRNGQTAAPSRRLARRARRLPPSLIEWDSDFHIRDWGRPVHESCGLDGVSPRSFLASSPHRKIPFTLHEQRLIGHLSDFPSPNTLQHIAGMPGLRSRSSCFAVVSKARRTLRSLGEGGLEVYHAVQILRFRSRYPFHEAQ